MPEAGRARFRELGWPVGRLQPGPYNAITDVPGVSVGHANLIRGEGPLRPGVGPVRTGVTVILPHPGNLFLDKVPAAVYTINGFGKAVGFEQVRELGVLEAPLALTNTLNVGRVLDGLVTYMLRQNPQIGVTTSSINIVVGETNDQHLNDLQGRHVSPEDVWAALEAARESGSGLVAEGAVGAGTGTICYGWKGGIGSASRVLEPQAGSFTLGVLVQTNFGRAQDLRVLGVPVGQTLTPDQNLHPQQVKLKQSAPASSDLDAGSVIVVLACNAPLGTRQLERLCKRAAAGLARTGSYFGHGSGDFVIAFSTAYTLPHTPPDPLFHTGAHLVDGEVLERMFQAVVEGVEEAVLNSLCSAVPMTGRDDHYAPALPLEVLQRLLAQALLSADA